MAKRIQSTIVLLLIFAAVFMFWDTWVLNACICFVVAACIYELFKATGIVGHKTLFALALLFSIGMTWFYNMDRFLLVVSFLLFIFALFAVLIKDHKTLRIEQVAMTFLFCVMIPTFMSSVLHLRDTTFGQFLVYLPFIGAWFTDSAAYLIGRKIGKHKLAPNISPNKSIEGAIGGIFGAILGCVLYGLLATLSGQVRGVIWPNMLLLAVLLSVIDQFGDLSFSLIKREFKQKDYGNAIPGHGGILDRFDGVLFVAPATYLLLKCMDIFVGVGI